MHENILIINIHSSKNIGDAALLDVALWQLRNNFPSGHYTLCMDDPSSHPGDERLLESITAWVHPMASQGKTGWNLLRLAWLLPASMLPVFTWRLTGHAFLMLTPTSLREILLAYLQADLVVSKPGGFLYSSGRGTSLFVALYSIILAILAGKPTYILPQSIGPLTHNWELRVTRWVLERVRLVLVREPVSLQVVRKCGVRNPRVHLVADMAFSYQAEKHARTEEWFRAQGLEEQDNQPRLGMTIVNWGAQNREFHQQDTYELACSAAARWFIKHTGGHVFFFPQVWGPLLSQDDRIPAKRTASLLADLKDKVHVVEKPLATAMLKSIYGKMDIFIGTRMHSNIFALSEGIPVIGIGYLDKTRGIATMAGIDQWVIDIQQVKASILVELLADLWNSRMLWQEHIRNKVPELIHQAEQVGSMVYDDYNTVVLRR